jgi:hypothetical protein
MKALISPVEQRETGYRVAEVSYNNFDVAPPLFWVDCADDVVADVYWYDPSDNSFKLTPESASAPESNEQPISQGAQDL